MFDPQIAGMLKAMELVFRRFGIDFFLVGAFARDIQLSAKPEFASKRQTNDVDIAVLLAHEEGFFEIKEALLATGHFEETKRNAIKLIYQQRIELDLLPFGEIEGEDRQLLLKGGSLLSMDMTGFREVYPFVVRHEIAPGHSLNVCPLEGLVLLKLIANDDNPSRTKDVTDIEHLVDVYFDLHFDELFADYPDTFGLYDTENLNYLQLVSARVIGRKMKALVKGNGAISTKLIDILVRRPVETWQSMAEGFRDDKGQ